MDEDFKKDCVHKLSSMLGKVEGPLNTSFFKKKKKEKKEVCRLHVSFVMLLYTYRCHYGWDPILFLFKTNIYILITFSNAINIHFLFQRNRKAQLAKLAVFENQVSFITFTGFASLHSINPFLCRIVHFVILSIFSSLRICFCCRRGPNLGKCKGFV